MSSQNSEKDIYLKNIFDKPSKRVFVRRITNEKKEREERVLPRTRSSEELCN